MTIVEEIDKKSNRPHRSKNIVDALKYAFDLKETPQNIGEAVKAGLGTGGGGYMGLKSVDVSLSVKSLPEDVTGLASVKPNYTIELDDQNFNRITFTLPADSTITSITVPVIDGFRTNVELSAYAVDSGVELMPTISGMTESDFTGDVELDSEHGYIYVEGPGSISVPWIYTD